MTKRGRLIVIAVSIAILLSAFGLPVTAYGSQNSGQSNPGGYVNYTLDLVNNTLINGNFVNTGNALEPWGIAYDPSNGYIYVANYGSGTVSVINGKNNTVIATIPVGSDPMGVAYDSSNGYIYVANWYSGTVSVINGTTVIANILVVKGPEEGPGEVAYDPSNGYIYVTIYGSNLVSVINGTTVIANIPVGIGPWGIAYDPSNGYIYVANYNSGTVSIIFTGVSTSSTSISSVTTPTTSTSTRPTSSVVPALAVVVAVVVVVLVVALLMIKHRKP